MKEYNIIPVYSKEESGKTEFVSFNGNGEKIRVHKDVFKSNDRYYVLNENELSSVDFRNIFGNEVKEYDPGEERNEYNRKLLEYLQKPINEKSDGDQRYNYIMGEYKAGNFEKDKNDSYDTLNRCRKGIVLKTQTGSLARLEWNGVDGVYLYGGKKQFTSKWLKQFMIADECVEFVNKLGTTGDLAAIEHEDFKDRKQYKDSSTQLTEDDVKELVDAPEHYFTNYEEILRGLFKDGKVACEVLEKCGVAYLSIDNPQEELARFIQNEAKECSVKDEYTVKSKPYLCRCQMCDTKSKLLVHEVSFEQDASLALCPECEARFEIVMQNPEKKQRFIENILNSGNDTTLKLSGTLTVYFTQNHLSDLRKKLSNTQNT